MDRRKIKELEDSRWCPPFFRNVMTLCMSRLRFLTIYDFSIRKLALLVKKSGKQDVVDLCTGSGGYLEKLQIYLEQNYPGLEPHFWHTDLFPNLDYFKEDTPRVTYCRYPLSAEAAIKKFDGVFCMFSALHHFDEEQLCALLETAAAENKPFIFSDICKNKYSILQIIFFPVMIYFYALSIRPFTWKHLLFIYILPLIPLFLLIDSAISFIKAYRVDELKAMYEKIARRYPDYRFKAGYGRCKFNIPGSTWIMGYPKSVKVQNCR